MAALDLGLIDGNDWDAAALDAVEQAITVRGVDGLTTVQRLALSGANRPTSRLVFDTDLQRWFYWNGTAWIWLGGTIPSCRLSKATQTVAAAAPVALLWTAEEFDTDTLHSTVTNTSRITIPAGYAGIWTLGYQTELAVFAGGAREAYMQVNGAGRHGWTQYNHSTASIGGVLEGAADIKLAVGDYVEVVVYQASGSAMNIGTFGGDRFWASYRGPA